MQNTARKSKTVVKIVWLIGHFTVDRESLRQIGPRAMFCFQWRYRTANSWGTCPNGKGKLGCGPQENFMGCADVSVTR